MCWGCWTLCSFKGRHMKCVLGQSWKIKVVSSKILSILPIWRKNCCCCSVANSCLTLCDPLGCSTPDFSILHHFLGFAQINVHWVGGYVTMSSSAVLFALKLSQPQNLFQWVGFSHPVAKVLEFQHQSFQWIFKVDFL